MFSRSRLLWGTVVFALIGIVNAGYLAYTSLAGISAVCTITHGCDLVASSPYSKVFGIPLSLFGVFFYTVVLGFAVWGLRTSKAVLRMFLIPVTGIGFLLSLYFLYLQAFVIEAYCQYCLLSLFDATVLFIMALMLARHEQPASSKPLEHV